MGTLLGHLSQFASFGTQGEVLCTQGLAYLLQEYPEVQAAFAANVAALTGVKIGDSLTWRAEAYQEPDGGRPDLEACTNDNGKIPKLKIEAKLGACLYPAQLTSYVNDLQSRSPESAFLILVPCRRTQEATNTVREVFGLSGPGPWRPADCPNVAVAVVSWDDLLAELGRIESARFRGELEQFDAMYKVLSGGFIQPLAGPEELAEWRERENDFKNLVEQVTRRLTKHHNVLPMGVEPPEQVPEGLKPKGYIRRYVCQPSQETESCFSIGVRDPFQGKKSPIWLRFNRSTGDFRGIHDRLNASHLEPRLVLSSGHVWIPLDVPLGVDATQMVNALVEQAEEILRVAYPSN